LIRSACELTREMLVLWLAREVDHAAWNGQSAHVVWCVGCAEWVMSHGWLWAELGEWADETAPAELDRVIRAAAGRGEAAVDGGRR
jgi:hypothetical protein